MYLKEWKINVKYNNIFKNVFVSVYQRDNSVVIKGQSRLISFVNRFYYYYHCAFFLICNFVKLCKKCDNCFKLYKIYIAMKLSLARQRRQIFKMPFSPQNAIKHRLKLSHSLWRSDYVNEAYDGNPPEKLHDPNMPWNPTVCQARIMCVCMRTN